MANSTALVRGELDAAVQRLRGLVTPETVHAFMTMHDYQPDPAALTFDAARWLEDVLADRRRALVDHIADLQEILAGVAERLSFTSTVLATVDSDAAGGLGPAPAGRR